MVMKILFLTVFSALGVMFLVVGARQYVQQKRLLSMAVSTSAEILESRVESKKSSDTDQRLMRDNSTTSHTPVVKFRYVVGGVTYESGMLRPSEIERGYASADAAREELTPFPVGAKVSAFVDPATPEKAFLIREESVGPIVFLVLALVAPAFGFVLSKVA